VSGQVSGVPLLYDFAQDDSLTGLLQAAHRKLLMNTDDMMPAKVVSYNRTTNVATVQPQIHMLTNNGGLIARGPVANINVLALGGGNFFVNFPLVAGSTGWIKANDRDISAYLQSSSASGPNTNRLHSFEDGLFIPDVMGSYTIAEADLNNMVISSTDGTVKITLSPTTVTVKAPNIVLDTPNLTMQDTGGTAAVTMTGNFAFVGSSLTHNGKNIGSTHEHSGVTTGGGNTGAPV
jgi:phage baseplate assembly protein gpV